MEVKNEHHSKGEKHVSNSAIVLCGGKGTRFELLGSPTPKSLLSIAGKTILDRQIELMEQAGIQHIYLAAGHLGEKIENHIRKKHYTANISIIDASELGTGGAIKKSLEWIPAQEKHFWVFMGDIYGYPNLKSMEKKLNKNQADGVILGTEVSNPKEYGVIFHDNQGKILDFVEKEIDKGKRIIDAGVYLLNKKIFDNEKLVGNFSVEYDVFPFSSNLSVQIHLGAWADIGTKKRLNNAKLQESTKHRRFWKMRKRPQLLARI